MGTYATFGDIGRISLPVTALFLASLFGWRETFFIIAGCGFFVYAITQWVLPLKKHTAHTRTSANGQSYKEFLSELPHFLKQKRLLLVTAAGAIDNIAANPIFLFLPFFVLEKGYPVAMLGVFTAFYFAGSLLGKTFLGHGADKFGTAKVFMLAEISMAVTVVIFTLVSHVGLLLGLAFLLGLFARGTTPLVATLFSEVTHEDHYEKAYGLGETFLGMSVIFSPILMGMIADSAGIVFVFYTAASLAVLTLIPILLLLKIGPIKEHHPVKIPEIG